MLQAINVRGTGATGDGATNDRTAIETAISVAKATGVGIFFPPGNYLVKASTTLKSLTIPREVDVSFEGGQLVIDGGMVITIKSLVYADSQTAIATASPASLKIMQYTVNVDSSYVPGANPPNWRFASVQAAIDHAPLRLWQHYIVELKRKDDFKEDVRIDGFQSAHSHVPGTSPGESSALRIRTEKIVDTKVKSTKKIVVNAEFAKFAKVRSIRVNSTVCPVQLKYLKLTGYSPFDNEHACIQAYYSIGVIAKWNDFSGAKQITESSKAISSYGSRIRTGENRFGDGKISVGLTTKTNGVITDDGGNSGRFKKHFVETMSGVVHTSGLTEVTADLELVRTSIVKARDGKGNLRQWPGFASDALTKSLIGPGGFARPRGTSISTVFEDTNWLTTQTSDSTASVGSNAKSGLMLATTTNSTMARASWIRDHIIGSRNWRDGVKTLTVALDSGKHKPGSVVYAVIGDAQNVKTKKVGFRCKGQMLFAVWCDGSSNEKTFKLGNIVGKRAVLTVALYGGRQRRWPKASGCVAEFYVDGNLRHVQRDKLPDKALPLRRFDLKLSGVASTTAFGELRCDFSVYEPDFQSTPG